MREAYNYAKKGAADELKVASPGTNRDTTTLINQQASAVAEKQMSDLLFQIKAQVMSDLRKNQLSETNLALTDILKALSDAFGSFFDKQVSLTGSIMVAMGVNRGRSDVFEDNRDQIAVYQYSAIMDAVVCPICADLDGKVVDYAEYRSSEWEPPIHFGCRCVWVAILSDQSDIPDVTGLPDNPGGAAQPAL